MKPTLVSEVDFEANPTATYHDTVRYDDDTVAYWRMNDNTALTDELGVNDGTITSTPTEDPSLLEFDADLALTFDGTDDRASVPNSSSLTSALTGSWSVHGMVEVQSIPGQRVLWTKGSVQLILLSDGRLHFRVYNHASDVATATGVSSTTALAAGEKHHVICVHDADADELRLYVDGLPEAVASHTVGTELWSLPWLFGAGHSGTSPAFGSVGANLVHGGGDPTATWPVPAPASIAVGDLLMVRGYLSASGAPAVISSTPAGWTAIISEGNPATGTHLEYVAYKIAAAGDVGAASYTWTFASALTLGTMRMMRFTGVDTAQPFANPPYMRYGSLAANPVITGTKMPQCDDTLALALVAQNRACSYTSDVGTEMFDSGGANTPGTALAGYYLGVATASGMGFTITSNGSVGIISIATLFLKGADAQDFSNVTLDEWAVTGRAFDDDEALDLSEARYSGEGTLTDMTSASRGVNIVRARQYELDRFEAGKLTETLKDEARNFDPANTDGDYYPNVKTKRRVRRSAVVGAETFPMFEGYVERWVPKYLAPAYQEASISAVDGMAMLALAPLSGSLPSGLSGAQIHRLLDIARWPRDKRAIDDGQFIMDSWELSGKALAAIQTIVDSELGQFFIDADGVATFHDYAHRWTQSRSLNVQAIFSDVQADVDAGAIRYLFGGIVPSTDDDTTINQWTVSTSTGASVTVKDVVGGRESFGLASERSTRLVSVADAETQARALLQHTARAGQRFDALTVSPNDETRWATILGLEISDLVRVIRTPAVGSQVTQDCFVEGIEIDTPNSEEWVVTFSLSPVSPATFYETARRSQPISYYRLNEAT